MGAACSCCGGSGGTTGGETYSSFRCIQPSSLSHTSRARISRLGCPADLESVVLPRRFSRSSQKVADGYMCFVSRACFVTHQLCCTSTRAPSQRSDTCHGDLPAASSTFSWQQTQVLNSEPFEIIRAVASRPTGAPPTEADLDARRRAAEAVSSLCSTIHRVLHILPSYNVASVQPCDLHWQHT